MRHLLPLAALAALTAVAALTVLPVTIAMPASAAPASERISQFRLRGVLSGTDGTSLAIVMSGKLTINANGTVIVNRSDFTCE